MLKPLDPKWSEVLRIIVDSDFDGVMCGAMLRIVFPEAEILQSKASEIQEGGIDHLLNSNTLLADLRYSPKIGFYFDHHESNKPSSDFIGSWKPYDSAARVVYEFFKESSDLSKFEPLLSDTDKFDAGKLSLEEYKNPSDIVKLALVINRDNIFFNLYLIEMLARYSFESVCKHPFIVQKIEDYENLKTEVLTYAKQHSDVVGKIAYVDISDFESKTKVASYVFTSYFEQSAVVVVVKKHQNPKLRKIRFYRNNFYDADSSIDLLKIAMEISPDTAGGHKGACGFTLEADFDKAWLIDKVKKALEN